VLSAESTECVSIEVEVENGYDGPEGRLVLFDGQPCKACLAETAKRSAAAAKKKTRR